MQGKRLICEEDFEEAVGHVVCGYHRPNLGLLEGKGEAMFVYGKLHLRPSGVFALFDSDRHDWFFVDEIDGDVYQLD
jgi:hypothetical protein